MHNPDFILHTLKVRFGFDSFRPHQLEIIQHVLDGGDALVIMPTGGGKSICYQLPALLQDGLTLVISPLISLMNDQVRSLRANGIQAGAIHSGTSTEENRMIHAALDKQELKILYVSPERALTNRFLDFIASKKVSLIAIDEAHCVSIWGNDFRPEYAQLTTLSLKFPNASVLALTATADKATQEDIRNQLQLSNPKTFLSSFERPNIHVAVKVGMERIEQIRDFLKRRHDQSGIIYCLARKSTEHVADRLCRMGFKAAAYHAELDQGLRKKVQDDFQADKIHIICATIAFGMGIDKPNIRWVVHYNLPKNIENYYQEIGRAGRDGKRADTLMFYSFGDVRVYRDFIEKSDANEEFKRVQYEKLDRIWDYSQATNCRTNVILNYFGEYRETPCGHCDHCLNPLRGFDGTRLAQMALSACKRCEESIGMGMLADVLRGSARKEIFEKKFHLIKTYGAGRDYSYYDWVAYLTQLINQGLLEIDYTQYSVLKCTPLSEAVLFGNKHVMLHQPVAAPLEPVALRQPKHVRFSEGLMEKLDALCEQIGHEEGLSREAVFSKKILSDIVHHRPVTKEDFLEIEGIDDDKSGKYSDMFLDTIRHYMTEQKIIKKPRGVTYIETLNLFRKGMTLNQIAQSRGMAEATIASHLAKLYEKGEDIDLQNFLTATDMVMARQAWRASGYSDQITKIKEEVGDSLDYAKLHMAVAILRRERLNA